MAIASIGGSFSQSNSGSFVEPSQKPFLNFGRNAAKGLLQQNLFGAQQFGQQAGADLFGQGQGFLSTLQSNPFLSALQQQAGGNPELLNAQIGQLGSDLGRSFQQQVLPGIRRDAGAVGALGGSRQGVAEGIAGQGFADAFSRGVTQLQTADAQRGLQAGIAGGGLQAQGALGGLSSLPGLFSTGMQQFTGGFAPLSLFNQIIGPPNNLNFAKSQSKSFDIGFG